MTLAFNVSDFEIKLLRLQNQLLNPPICKPFADEDSLKGSMINILNKNLTENNLDNFFIVFIAANNFFSVALQIFPMVSAYSKLTQQTKRSSRMR
jgi:hypothetical protein